MTETAPTIGFLGLGRMATALARGFVASGVARPESLVGYDVVPEAGAAFRDLLGGKAVASPAEVLAEANVVFLAVKPQHVAEVLDGIGNAVEERHLVVSVAAGVTLATLEAGLPPGSRVIRVMPNTPCLIGAGAAAFATGSAATEADAALVERLLSTVGLAERLPESQLDAVTGLSGSGPAYAYQIVEALSDGGVLAGLPRDVATRLAAQTLLGAARMVLESGEHPGALKDAVTSPGGTTIAGLHALERGGLRGLLMDAVQAATERSRELSRPR